MPILDLRTIACDAPECTKSTIFNPKVQEDILALPEWVRTTRTVQLGNGSTFTYCSDVCEVKGVTTGVHNVPEPATIEGATPAQAALAGKQSEAVDQLRTKHPRKSKVSLS